MFPSLSLAFEYQGEHHYLHSIFGELPKIQNRDDRKKHLSNFIGISLIQVPFWWNRQISSLAETIKYHRPDIILPASIGFPIPFNIPKQKKRGFKRNIFLPYNNFDPTGWLISEKYDGVRVYWNGKGNLFSSRLLPIRLPKRISDLFPNYPFEGELWCGYESSNISQNLLISNADELKWDEIKIMVYDTPLETNVTYEKRLEILKNYISPDHKILKLVDYKKCFSKEDFDIYYKSILNKGGEGLILRKPSSFYFQQNTLFFKKEFLEREALVIENSEGKFKCLLSNGAPFLCDSNSVVPNQSIITVRYSNKTKYGIPIDSKYLCTRNDLKKEDIFDYYVETGKSSQTTCRGCRKRIPKEALRIQTRLNYNFQNVLISFHINDTCLRNGIKYNKSEQLEKFYGIVWTKRQFQDQIPEMKGIEWNYY